MSVEEPFGGSSLRTLTIRLFENAIKQYCPKEKARILDVGCGNGSYFRFFFTNQINGEWLGIDILEGENWKEHLSTNQDKSLNINFATLDATQLSEHLKGDFYNFVYSIYTLEHIREDVQVVEEIYKVAARDSYQIFMLPSRLYWIFHFGRHGYHYYSLAETINTLKRSQFEIVEVAKLGGFTSFFIYLFLEWYPYLLKAPIYFGLRIFSPDKLTLEFKKRLNTMARIHQHTRIGRFVFNTLAKWSIVIDRLLPFFRPLFAIVTKKVNRITNYELRITT